VGALGTFAVSEALDAGELKGRAEVLAGGIKMFPSRTVDGRRSECRRLPAHQLSPITLHKKARAAGRSALFALIAATCPTAFAAISTGGSDVTPDPSGGTVAGTVIIGNTTTGTLTIDAGSTLTAGGFSVANNAGVNGTVTVVGTTSGAQTTLNLLGPASLLQLGRWGTGSLTLQDGAIMNAGLDLSTGLPSATCLQNNCNVFIGGSAGATGTLTLTGAGTTANLAAGLIVAEAFAGSAAHPPIIGTPGQNASGTIQIQNGATLNSTVTTLGFVPTGFAELGTELATAHVVVDGTGSAWNITANAVSGASANLTIGRDVRGSGTVDVTNSGHVTSAGFVSVGESGSGTLNIGSGGWVTAHDMNIGNQTSGVGNVTVGGGAGQSTLTLNNSLVVGNSSTATSTLTVNSGGVVNVNGNAFLGIGSVAGGVGSVTVDGGSLSVVGTNAFPSVGNNGTGTLTVQNGGQFTSSILSVGSGVTGNGTVNIIGTGVGSPTQTMVNLSPALGTNAPNLDIGAQGTANMTVSNGAIVNFAVANANCASMFCGSFVGDGAGSTAHLTLTGAGTTMNVGGSGFVVGNAVVFTLAHDGNAFGTPGGTTNATLLVQSGATLNTYQATVSNGLGGGAPLGTEQSIATATVDGAGSTWNITRNPNTGNQAQLTVGRITGATGTVDVTNGGQIVITGSRSNPLTDNTTPGIAIGGTSASAGGNATINVDGSGSKIVINGDTGFINIGRNAATGTLSITNDGQVLGGTANGLMNMNIGRLGSTGTLNVDGAGSQLTLSGVCGVNTGCDGNGAFINIGRDSGSQAFVNVTNGGKILVSDGGQAANNGSTGFWLGRDASSSGTMLVSGATTTVTVEQTGAGTAVPLIMVGRVGNGAMTVTDGANVFVNGPSERDFIVGGAAGGTGTLIVSNGAKITASWFTTGNNGGTGTTTIDNATVLLNGLALNPGQPDFGASARVGRGAGSTGTLNLVNNAHLIIDTATAAPNINLGGTGNALGGSGTLNMSGGSTITFIGTATTPSVNIGHSGFGLLTMDTGSAISLPNDGNLVLANRVTGNGTLQIGGGSTIDTGLLVVGNNGHGTVTMTGGTIGVHGSDVNTGAGLIVGASGTAVGSFAQSGGVVSVDSQVAIGQDLGSSGSYMLTGGTLNSRNMSVGVHGTGVFVNSDPVPVSATHNVAGNLTVGEEVTGNGSYTITGNNAQTNVNFNPGGNGQTDPPGVNGFNPPGTPRPAPNGGLGVGVFGTGTFTQGAANFSDPGNTVNVAGDLAVGVFAGGQGAYTLNTGTLTVGGKLVIGGQSQSAANVFTQKGGSVNVTGSASSNSDYVGLGGNEFSGALIVGGGINDLGGGTGKYVMSGGTLTAGAVLVGNNGGTGTFSQSGGSVSTGALSIGTASTGAYGMNGAATALNVAGNQIVGDAGTGSFAQNGGSDTIGGQLIIGNQSAGNGTFQASGGASVVLTGTSATAKVVVGNQGTGALTLESGSTMTLPGNGSMIVGATATGSGNVFVDGTSSLQAGSLIGLGHDGIASTGGQGKLIVDGSVTATSLVIGENGCLAGNGVVHANVTMNGVTGNIGACPPSPPTPIVPFGVGPSGGGVTPFGIINAGRSPGRLVIDGGFDFVSGTIVLEVESDGHGGFLVDQLVFSNQAIVNLAAAMIEFSFLGNTDPNAFENSGLWDLDTFFKINTTAGFASGNDQPISDGLDQSLDTIFAQSTFEATSNAYVIENFTFTPEGGVGEDFTAVPIVTVPEPAPWMLMLAAFLLLYLVHMHEVAAVTRRR
jgi:T5SS/PEP-CTERM-associated repeat protein